MGAPVLIGAGVGALGSAVMGGNPLKGALLGGVSGGALGGAGGIGSGFTQGGLFSTLPTTAASTGGAVAGTAPSAFLTPTTPEIGMANTFNTAQGGFLGGVAPEFSQTLANDNLLLNPAGMGGLTPISSAEYAALAKAAETDPSIWEKVKPYITAQNMMGVGSIMSSLTPKQQQIPSSGGKVIRGSFQPKNSDLSTGDLLTRKKTPFLLG